MINPKTTTSINTHTLAHTHTHTHTHPPPRAYATSMKTLPLSLNDTHGPYTQDKLFVLMMSWHSKTDTMPVACRKLTWTDNTHYKHHTVLSERLRELGYPETSCHREDVDPQDRPNNRGKSTWVNDRYRHYFRRQEHLPPPILWLQELVATQRKWLNSVTDNTRIGNKECCPTVGKLFSPKSWGNAINPWPVI